MDKKFISLAIDNVVNYGDTDIFPFPVENIVFRDKKDDIIDLICKFDRRNLNERILKQTIGEKPPQNIYTCSPIGYNGFRWATCIEPFWNVYLLSLVISISTDLEKTRIPKNVVHSYRYKPDIKSGSLFDKKYGWMSFQEQAELMAKNGKYQYVLSCDIADFYNRIYHHDLIAALLQATSKSNIVNKIKHILTTVSNGTSYGLPIGGPASRILAEQVLHDIDKLMSCNKIKFVRFVDDYYIFANTLEQAHSYLNFMTNILMSNQGLSLQKHKTQIISKIEFLNLIKNRIRGEGDDQSSKEKTKFMSLPIKYDPYSPTAKVDYERIKGNLKDFNILSLLNEELQKSKIHQQFSKRLIQSLDVADKEVISDSFKVIVQKYQVLYPIFPTIMIAAFKNYDRLNKNAQDSIINSLLDLFDRNSHIIQNDLNLAYAIRVLGLRKSDENESLIVQVYNDASNNEFIKNICLQIMIRWKSAYFISDLKTKFSNMQYWQRRMFIIGSYILKEEGRHWRNNTINNFNDLEKIINNWSKENFQIRNWMMPL
ncbi:MAG: reverse transcriptase domain-containing protein [Candidatus Kapaibacterium sp.]